MYESIIEAKKIDLEDVVGHFKDEIAKIRTGRANPALIENIFVDYYGAKTPVKQVATISVPEARLITVNPWDKNSMAAIETAIRSSGLNLNPTNDGQLIRISIPPLNEERRVELVKVLNQEAEKARIGVRNVREDVWGEIQEKEKTGEISEDDKFRGKDKLQKVIDEYNNQVEDLRKKKEEEIMTI
jgi:ribosome recycling factor